MFTAWDKALVAAIMAILQILDSIFGISLGITEGWLHSVLAVLTPILVWYVPNRTR